MLCPECKNNQIVTLETRPTKDKDAIRRRRSCNSCNHRWVTEERIIETKRSLAYKNKLHTFETLKNALEEILSTPKDWNESYGNAYTTCIRIAGKALDSLKTK